MLRRRSLLVGMLLGFGLGAWAWDLFWAYDNLDWAGQWATVLLPGVCPLAAVAIVLRARSVAR